MKLHCKSLFDGLLLIYGNVALENGADKLPIVLC